MHAKVLKYSVAPASSHSPPRGGEHPAWSDPVQTVPDPAWPDVEAAVRRLDGRRYRHLELWPTADASKHDPNPGEHEFLTVIGGDRAYVVTVSFENGREHFLHFPERPRRDVIVLPDASGFVDGAWTESACRVCQDVEVVVRAVRHYAEQGGLEPSLSWETLTC